MFLVSNHYCYHNMQTYFHMNAQCWITRPCTYPKIWVSTPGCFLLGHWEGQRIFFKHTHMMLPRKKTYVQLIIVYLFDSRGTPSFAYNVFWYVCHVCIYVYYVCMYINIYIYNMNLYDMYVCICIYIYINAKSIILLGRFFDSKPCSTAWWFSWSILQRWFFPSQVYVLRCRVTNEESLGIMWMCVHDSKLDFGPKFQLVSGT